MMIEINQLLLSFSYTKHLIFRHYL